MSASINRLVLIGNGFDLAHGLKTSYRNFIDWYMCNAFHEFCERKNYNDCLIEIKNKYAGTSSVFKSQPTTFEEVLRFIGLNDLQSIKYNSNFFQRIITSFKASNWVDIEIYYFRLLKAYFLNPNLTEKKEIVSKVNAEFDFLIQKLSEYIQTINSSLTTTTQLKVDKSKCNLSKAFGPSSPSSDIKFLDFNYTDTLTAKDYANNDEVIHIHGRVSDVERNPIIFGYGDESDPAYQKIEDSGENIYLEHIKSFGYFKTDNYRKLLSYIDSAPYIVYVVGHSCGLSDRILLSEIFENKNCQLIEIFYHDRKDGSNNFKEITQEISRHFKPHNKDLMRRKVMPQDRKNIIPQN